MDILVSGAGIAGLACARELGVRGHDVTVVEYGSDLRLAGTPIDIRGHAIEAVDGMGLLATVRQRRVRMSELTHFVDSTGEPIARIPLAQVNDSDDDIELLREDLVRILAEAVPDEVAVRFGDTIATLTDDGAGVDVRFVSGRTARYDVVIGADGQHSAVRKLVFASDDDCLRHLGVHFALVDLPHEAQSDCANTIYNVPSRMAGVFNYGGKTVAVFQFRSESVDIDHRDLNAQRRTLVNAFAGYRSWRIPELLDAVGGGDGFYFASASQVHLPSWRKSRVVLVGDAGYCPSFLSGRGTTLALSGAGALAEELGQCGDDVTAAFARYEARLRPHVRFAQARAVSGRDHMLPATWAALDERNRTLQAAQ